MFFGLLCTPESWEPKLLDRGDGVEPLRLAPHERIARFADVPKELIDPLEVTRQTEHRVYELVADFLHKNQLRPEQVVIDPTGGKKTMSGALTLAGHALGIPLIYVDCVDYSFQGRVPTPGTEFPRRLLAPPDKIWLRRPPPGGAADHPDDSEGGSGS